MDCSILQLLMLRFRELYPVEATLLGLRGGINYEGKRSRRFPVFS